MENIFKKRKRKHGEDSDGQEVRTSKKNKNSSDKYEHKSRTKRVNIDLNSRTDSSEGKSRLSAPQKMANLLSALNGALGEDGIDETIRLIGRPAFTRSLDLRALLDQNQPTVNSSSIRNSPETNVDSSSIKTSPETQPKSPDHANIPKSMSGFSLTPWKASEIPKSLPPLPSILDPTLEAGAFIHQGTTSGEITDLSYERLEWVGDAYLYVTATLLISQTFPSLLPGKCSQIRERLVKNLQLAEYSRQYDFEKRAKLPDGCFGIGQHSWRQQERVKVLGDIFEAYVAAVVLSDPVNGLARCSEWLKGLWGMTLAKEIMKEESKEYKMDNPLWRLRGSAEPVKLVADASEREYNPKDKLRRLISSKGIKLTYKDSAPERKDPTNKLPLFSVGVYLDGWGDKDKLLGYGRANGKKDAGMKAAEMAMENVKLMKVYVEKKRIYDAQAELEREALEQSGVEL